MEKAMKLDKLMNFEKCRADSFLLRHNMFINYDVEALTRAFLYDMACAESGGKAGGLDEPGLLMIPTWFCPKDCNCEGEKAIIIDAGGTNFRTALVEFETQSNAEVCYLQTRPMPGTDGAISVDDFFNIIANELEYLKGKADVIGFCFSYGMVMTHDLSGIAMKLSKEVKVEGIEGVDIGKKLYEVLKAKGWKDLKKIVVINDTVAVLMAAMAIRDRDYDAYLGFVMGTGINVAFLGDGNACYNGEGGHQIIVTEAGKMNKISLSDFDKELDSASLNPGDYITEKQAAGGYLWNLILRILHTAAQENMFCLETKNNIMNIKDLRPEDILDFCMNLRSDIDDVFNTEEDSNMAYYIIDNMLDRAARIAAAMISAAVLKSGVTAVSLTGALILCNGSTFKKAYNMKQRIRDYLATNLSQTMDINATMATNENDIAIGTALTAIMAKSGEQ